MVVILAPLLYYKIGEKSMWAKVDKIEYIERECAVYDLTVDGEMYFVYGVAVHNCPHNIVVESAKDSIPDCASLWRGQVKTGRKSEQILAEAIESQAQEYNLFHYPSGSARGGQFAPKGTGGATGVLSTVLRVQVSQDMKDMYDGSHRDSWGREYATAFDGKGNRINGIVEGKRDPYGGFSTDVGALMKQNTHVLVHNHPSGASFSDADMGTFMSSNIQHLVVIGGNGNLYRLSKPPKYVPPSRHLYNAQTSVAGLWQQQRQELSRSYKIKIAEGKYKSEDAAWIEMTHQIVTTTARALRLSYERITP